ncbi:MAG: CoA transferase [Chloroflexi bacterium]|nr:CoA transferase [Chloroflexota bacterium]
MPAHALRSLTSALDLPETNRKVEIVGRDPVLQTNFRVGEAAAAALAAVGLAVSDIWKLRTGRAQHVRVEVPLAAASLISFTFQRLTKSPTPQRGPRLTDFFPTRDGRWFLVHQGFPKNRQSILALLSCEATAESIAQSVAGWDAQELEDKFGELGLCGAMVRTEEEWAGHDQAIALAEQPVVDVTRVGDSDPEPFAEGDRPLSGVRMLDLTRVLAGPTCGRTLAAHGADVLRIDSPELPSIAAFVMDTGHGKRSAHLDLKTQEDADQLRALVRDADVFAQGYRSGAINRLGFGPEALHELRPGLIYTSINCYGHTGPWQQRPGWEQLAQTVTGIAAEHGDERPRLLPAAATDYTTGYLAALGTVVALARRAREGGSYHVRVSLSRTGMWLQSLGRTTERGAGVTEEIVAPAMTDSDTPHGKLYHLGPVLELSETQPRWERPTVPIGTHEAEWA